MKVILLNDIRGVGRRNEIKEVAEGYARNYLFVHGYAMPADKKGLIARSHRARVSERELELMRACAKKIETQKLIFSIPANKEGMPFGGVGKEMILQTLMNKRIKKEEATIMLERSIRRFGTHSVKIILPRGITAVLTVVIQPE